MANEQTKALLQKLIEGFQNDLVVLALQKTPEEDSRLQAILKNIEEISSLLHQIELESYQK